jgi:hypothetical protein
MRRRQFIAGLGSLRAGRADILSINCSAGAHGGPAFFKNHEALSAAYRDRR